MFQIDCLEEKVFREMGVNKDVRYSNAKSLSTAEVARRVGCSFATAWQVAQDFKLLYPEQDRREYDNPNSQLHDVGV